MALGGEKKRGRGGRGGVVTSTRGDSEASECMMQANTLACTHVGAFMHTTRMKSQKMKTR